MRFLPTKIHGLPDYLTGIALYFPLSFAGPPRDGCRSFYAFLLVAAVGVYSVCTNNEWDAFRTLSKATHLMFDLVGGELLAE